MDKIDKYLINEDGMQLLKVVQDLESLHAELEVLLGHAGRITAPKTRAMLKLKKASKKLESAISNFIDTEYDRR